MVIGITGNSGSGKTFIANVISKKINAKMVNADEIVKKMSVPGNTYYNEIVKKLGSNFLNEDKTLNKTEIANLIFSNLEERKIVNEITNKYIVPEIIKEIEGDTVLDVPLLFESELNKVCDFTIVVIADEESKINRIISRDNVTKEMAIKRLQAQSNEDYYKNKANYIIYNDEKNLDEKINNILKERL